MAGSLILLIFVLWGCFNCRLVRFEERSHLGKGSAEIASFCCCFMSQIGSAESRSISLFSLHCHLPDYKPHVIALSI